MGRNRISRDTKLRNQITILRNVSTTPVIASVWNHILACTNAAIGTERWRISGAVIVVAAFMIMTSLAVLSRCSHY